MTKEQENKSDSTRSEQNKDLIDENDLIKNQITPPFYYTISKHKLADKPNWIQFSLGPAFFFHCSCSPQIFIRDQMWMALHPETNYIVIQFLISGSGKVICGENSFNVSNQLHVINLNKTSRFECHGMEVVGVALPTDFVMDEYPRIARISGIISNSGDILEKIFKDIILSIISHREIIKENEFNKIKLLLIKNLNIIIDRREQSRVNYKSDNVIDFIMRNIRNSELSIEYISKHLFISRASLYRKFKIEGGINHFISAIRVKICYNLIMKNTQMRIKDIAIKLGFKSPSYLSTCFKKFYGISPHQMKIGVQNRHEHRNKKK
ncbi:helix-turn-helix domain-containing protein [Celerinatantimonas sp. MCCC 1A17872]|uniref:helix-turn-helix domain-containing protein n=1 Tax=Celerinatantimonas sp. MCCC 1A17872 TaxID=3177514 RepID=UPI0038C300BD